MKTLISKSIAAIAATTVFVGAASAATLTLTGTVRDFSDSHPDMESTLGVDPGIVETMLGLEIIDEVDRDDDMREVARQKGADRINKLGGSTPNPSDSGPQESPAENPEEQQ